jgi:hypothetical protein
MNQICSMFLSKTRRRRPPALDVSCDACKDPGDTTTPEEGACWALETKHPKR